MKTKTRFMTQAAMIAALYVVLTLIANSMGLALGPIQIRFSESLTILPFFTLAAVPGLYLGCLIGNLVTGAMPLDIVLGSLATLLGAFGTYYLRKHQWLAPVPPILSNVIIVPWILKTVYEFEGSYLYFCITVGVGQVLSCGVLGGMLLLGLKPYANIFRLR